MRSLLTGAYLLTGLALGSFHNPLLALAWFGAPVAQLQWRAMQKDYN